MELWDEWISSINSLMYSASLQIFPLSLSKVGIKSFKITHPFNVIFIYLFWREWKGTEGWGTGEELGMMTIWLCTIRKIEYVKFAGCTCRCTALFCLFFRFPVQRNCRWHEWQLNKAVSNSMLSGLHRWPQDTSYSKQLDPLPRTPWIKKTVLRLLTLMHKL